MTQQAKQQPGSRKRNWRVGGKTNEMKEILFKADGGLIKFKIEYKGPIVAEYTYRLREAGSNAVIVEKTGDNDNPEDDLYYLPTPVSGNDNRKISIGSDFASLDGTSSDVQWQSIVTIYQGASKIGEEIIKGEYPTDDGSYILIKLKKS